MTVVLDSQSVELLGRNELVAALIRAGIEVALPLRDRGIDLLAYLDQGPQLMRFEAVPIQMKASKSASFSIDQKYAKFPNLIIAFVWFVDSPSQKVVYALKYHEAVRIAESMGFTSTSSWEMGSYAVTRPGKRLVEAMQAYAATPARWRSLLSQESLL